MTIQVTRSNFKASEDGFQYLPGELIVQSDDANYQQRKRDVVIKLSPREQEVLDLYAQKGRLKPVADALGSSLYTVRTQKNSILRKLGVSNSVQMVRTAIEKGLVKL